MHCSLRCRDGNPVPVDKSSTNRSGRRFSYCRRYQPKGRKKPGAQDQFDSDSIYEVFRFDLRPVGKVEYQLFASAFQSGEIIPGVLLPFHPSEWSFSAAILSVFVGKSELEDAVRTDDRELASNDFRQTHPTGQKWNTLCRAQIPRFVVLPDSRTHNKLLDTETFASALRAELASRTAEVRQQMQSAAKGTTLSFSHRFDRCLGCSDNVWSAYGPERVLFDRGTDFKYAVGKVRLRGAVFFDVDSDTGRVSRINVSASFEDLIDFDVKDGDFVTLAALVQAGHPTLGAAGQTFLVEFPVVLDSTEFDFYPNDRSRTDVVF